MFNSIFSTVLRLTTLCVALGLGAFVAVHASPARAEQLWDTRELLSQHFRSSERVTFVRIAPQRETRARIEKRLGRALPKASYTFFVATTRGKVDGYALFDDERGQHEPITFATFFDADGHVTRVEIVAYREAYGDGIRAERFRKQFVGRSVQSGFRPGDDIDAVSGATISSRSMCLGVQRAAVLFDEAIAKAAPTTLATLSPAQASAAAVAR